MANLTSLVVSLLNCSASQIVKDRQSIQKQKLLFHKNLLLQPAT